ncbi:CAP domain-containing protein [Enterococcus sp. 12E11_DIV0728]|uniref:CAP domain-containing protein n=1 Tax=Enterococcus sp. 12E11_DIV0728 TaxID=1834168 RepID=UPI0015934CBC|nr:CAP domain-containing protein [Enterococcus sp. 12E11_DIV0728]
MDIWYNNVTDINELNKLRVNIDSITARYQTATVNGTLSSDGSVTLKNPIKDIEGKFILPSSNSSYMSYEDDVIKWKNTNGKQDCYFAYKTPDNMIDYSLTMTVTHTDKRALEDLINTLKDTDKGNYTKKSWDNFQTALDSAKKVLEDEKAIKDTVEKSISELQKAFDELIEKASSKEELKTFVEKVDKLYWRQDYSSGYSELTKACSDAKKIIDNDDASQTEVDEVLAELKKLEENLVTYGNAAIPLDQRLAEARTKFLELINEERKSKDMNTLAYSDGLNSLADVRADEQQVLYSHTRPNGSNVLYAGQKYGFTFLDECLTDSLFRDSYGYQKSGEDIGQTMFDSWKSSSAHYNIMVRTTRQTHIGLSFVVNKGNTFRMYGVLLVGWN